MSVRKFALISISSVYIEARIFKLKIKRIATFFKAANPSGAPPSHPPTTATGHEPAPPRGDYASNVACIPISPHRLCTRRYADGKAAFANAKPGQKKLIFFNQKFAYVQQFSTDGGLLPGINTKLPESLGLMLVYTPEILSGVFDVNRKVN